LFAEAGSSKQSYACMALWDTILKSDRTMVMGDYKTVELFCQKQFERAFPRLDPLGKLFVHYQLAEAYEKMGAAEKAIPHHQYCLEHCGETSFGMEAEVALARLR